MEGSFPNHGFACSRFFPVPDGLTHRRLFSDGVKYLDFSGLRGFSLFYVASLGFSIDRAFGKQMHPFGRAMMQLAQRFPWFFSFSMHIGIYRINCSLWTEPDFFIFFYFFFSLGPSLYLIDGRIPSMYVYAYVDASNA